jgi:hypothetical protein
VTWSDAVLRYEKTDFQKAVAAKFASLEGLGNWRRVEADRSVEDVHVTFANDVGGGGGGGGGGGDRACDASAAF